MVDNIDDDPNEPTDDESQPESLSPKDGEEFRESATSSEEDRTSAGEEDAVLFENTDQLERAIESHVHFMGISYRYSTMAQRYTLLRNFANWCEWNVGDDRDIEWPIDLSKMRTEYVDDLREERHEETIRCIEASLRKFNRWWESNADFL